MKSITTALLALTASVTLSNCHAPSSSTEKNLAGQRIGYTRQQTPEPIGNSDSAKGYVYSELLQKKIRLFEEGIRVLPTTGGETILAAYLVFATDSSQVELFLPDRQVILGQRQRPDGTSVWNQEDDDTYLVEKKRESWLVSRQQQLLYTTDGTEDIHPALFTTEEGDTVKAAFFQKAETVQLTIQGQPVLLRQYRTASGYGYKNAFYDLRGKGTQAQLTRLSDNKTYQLNEQ